jgi:RNA polymerase sigma-70 factor (ECF subfamily)
MSGSSLSTTSLQRVVARDAAVWQRVFELYRPLVYSRCRRLGLGADDAADVVQEAFLAAFQSIEHFRRDSPGSNFRGWLLGIAANKLKDHWERKAKNPQAKGGREAQRRIGQVTAPGDDSFSKEADAAEKGGLLRRALEMMQTEFQERTWKAFWRFDIDGRSATDVAADLGMTPNAVHVAVCRVRKRLREEFGDLL